ncbi:hypothetical protein LCGC14_1418730 [marine sediment metagenome]|uniref:ATP-dependent DNA ligase family profile domain-containing protein n=1 Tax=marine sediment metagenome TaxID=412755 RepID=A0A0F9JRU5_9ZZZZ
MEAVSPMLAQTAQEATDDPDRIFDLKYNGMRIVGHVEDGESTLLGRSGIDYTWPFPELHDLAKRVTTKRAVLDGEVVCLGADGLPDFNALQKRYSQRDPLAIKALMERFPARFQVFDVVEVDEFDLTSAGAARATQMQRREILEKVLAPGGSVYLSPYVDGNATDLMKEVLRINKEGGRQVFDGIMSKSKSGLYVPGGRGADWQKVKIPQWGTFVICGYTKGTGWREDMMGAVVLGDRSSGSLSWVGCAGSGFKLKQLQDLHQTLLRMRTATSPFPNGTKVPKLDSWVRPELSCLVKYYDTTKAGQLIWPIFQRLLGELPDSGPIPASLLAEYQGSLVHGLSVPRSEERGGDEDG